MKEKQIVRRTLANRKQGRTDWQRLRNMSEDDIDRAALSDAENPPWTADELRNARLVLRANEAKVPLSIRLDREVIDYFKDQGPGYQSRIGAVLLSYVRSQEAASSEYTPAAVAKRASRKKSQTTTAKQAAKAKKKTRTTK
jgi:uncharacterized protein (DUF4415 family)